jgi:hypothetical protein
VQEGFKAYLDEAGFCSDVRANHMPFLGYAALWQYITVASSDMPRWVQCHAAILIALIGCHAQQAGVEVSDQSCCPMWLTHHSIEMHVLLVGSLKDAMHVWHQVD